MNQNSSVINSSSNTAGNALADMEGVLNSLRPRRLQAAKVRITTLHSFASSWLIPRLPEFARAAAAETARDRKLNAPYAATTSRS